MYTHIYQRPYAGCTSSESGSDIANRSGVTLQVLINYRTELLQTRLIYMTLYT